MFSILRGVIPLLSVMSLRTSSVEGQTPRYAPIVLQLPAGTRASGLAGAVVAIRDIESIFSNPALAGLGNGSAISFGRLNGAASLGTLASSINMGAFGVALGAEYLDFHALDANVPVSGEALTLGTGPGGSSLAGAFALSTLFKRYRVGAALKYVEERIGAARDGTPAFDLGVAKEGGQITVGLSVQNIGPAIDFVTSKAQLPLRATLGLTDGVPVGPFDLFASGAVSVLRNGFVAPMLGMELGYSPLEGYNFVVRGGVRRPELHEQAPVTLGASFALDRFTVDYGFEDLRHGVEHRVGIRVR